MDEKPEHRYPEIELQSADKHGNGSFSGHYFQVEVRTSSGSPVVLSLEGERRPFVIDHCWRHWPVYRGAIKWGCNVPIRSWDHDAADHGLLPYLAAEAHRRVLLAALEAYTIGGSLCIETRLVEVKFSKTYNCEEIGVTPALRGGWRTPKNTMPRYPKVPD